MTSFVDMVRPRHQSRWVLFSLLCILGGSLFLAFLSQISIRLWFTPIPITMQTLGVMLLAALLGSKKATLSTLLYLFEGAMGFPVFAEGKAGVAALLGPTAGYLFAFVLASWLIGWLLEKGWKERYILTLCAMTLGTMTIWLGGALWLSLFIGLPQAFLLGVCPFVIGCLLKIFTATALIPSGWKALHYFSRL